MNNTTGVYTYQNPISSLGEYLDLIYSLMNDSPDED